MRLNTKITAVAAAAVIAGWAGVTGPTATAATAQCGSGCASLYNLEFGTSDVLAVIGASGTSAYTGELADLQAASGSNQAEDWKIDAEDTVNDFYQAGLVSADVNTHYGSDEAYEFQYTPDGVWSGLCLGTPGLANNGGAVSLQPCGENADTLWIYDTADQYQRDVPFVTATDTNFTYPYVLTGNTTGVQLTTSELTGGDGVIENGQYWSTEYGVLP